MGVTRRFKTAAGRRELQAAFATIAAAAAEVEHSADAAHAITFGGAVSSVLTDREYAESFLAMVNYNSHLEDFSIKANSSGSLVTDCKLAEWESTLDAIRENPKRVAQINAHKWGRVMQARALSVPTLIEKNGQIETAYKTIVFDGEAAQIHALQMLTSQPMSSELRRCVLPSCRRYFLSQLNRSGPHPKYCRSECLEVGKREKNLSRIHKYRTKKTSKRQSGE